jgi:hypothetical protein
MSAHLTLTYTSPPLCLSLSLTPHSFTWPPEKAKERKRGEEEEEEEEGRGRRGGGGRRLPLLLEHASDELLHLHHALNFAGDRGDGHLKVFFNLEPWRSPKLNLLPQAIPRQAVAARAPP